MQTQQIVRASADVLTITTLRPGDVYKRVETPSYGGEATLRFGIVQDVMNNGEDAAVSAIEFAPDYNGANVKTRVITGGPAAIFPATPDEVRAHFAEVEEALDREVKTKREAFQKAVATQEAFANLLDRYAAHLTAPETSTAALPAPEPAEDPAEDDEPAL